MLQQSYLRPARDQRLTPATQWVLARAGLAGIVGCLGFVVGFSLAILPLNMIILPLGIIIILALITFWVMPELARVPTGFLKWSYIVFIPIMLCIPPYLAVDPPGLPWISIVRVSLFTTMILFMICIFGSSKVRSELTEALKAARPLDIGFYGVMITFFLSIPLSAHHPSSVNEFFNSLIYWFFPFACGVLVIRKHQDVILIFKIMAFCAIILFLIGLYENTQEYRFFLNITPRHIFNNDPLLLERLLRPSYRYGMYRSSASYMTPLAYSEGMALLSPIFLYFMVYGKSLSMRVIGFVALVSAFGSIILSGSRGGVIGFFASGAFFAFFVGVREFIHNKRNLLGPVVLTAYAGGVVAFIGLVFSWRRLYVRIFGGGEAAGSTEARFTQWDMALPHIASNPLTGHGVGMASAVVGYRQPNGNVSLDSYVITLLVDAGIPGFVMFFFLFLSVIWIGVKYFLKRPGEETAILLPIASGFIGFLIYRFALSQTENMALAFLLIGILTAVVARLKQTTPEGKSA